MTLAPTLSDASHSAEAPREHGETVDADFERAPMEGLSDPVIVSSLESGWADRPDTWLPAAPAEPQSGTEQLEASGVDTEFVARLLDGLSVEPSATSEETDWPLPRPESEVASAPGDSIPIPAESPARTETEFERVPRADLARARAISPEVADIDGEDAATPRQFGTSSVDSNDPPRSDPLAIALPPSGTSEEVSPSWEQPVEPELPDLSSHTEASHPAEAPDADPSESTEFPTPEPVQAAAPIDDGLESALLAGLADEPATAPEGSDDPGVSDEPLEARPASHADVETPEAGPIPEFDFERTLLEGLPDGSTASFDDADPSDLPESAAPMPEASPAATGPGAAGLPDADDFASELLDGLSDGLEVSSGDPEPPDLPAAPGAGDDWSEPLPAEPSRFPDELPDPEPDAASTHGFHADAEHRPVAALAFAADPDTERALREGLLRYESPSSGLDEPQVWPGGIRAAISALADGHTSGLVIVDLDGIPFPVGAIHELAEVCEAGTAVIALGSEDTARVSREVLLAGVSDYLVKPVTAEAVRRAALRATGAGDASPVRGCVAGFAGTGGSGATTLAAATALHAAAEGRYVSVLDLDRRVSAIGLLLDVEPAPGLDQLFEVAGGSSPDPKLLDGVRTERSERISVYAYRLGTSLPPVPSMPALDWLLGQLRRRSQLVLVDGLDDPETRFDLLDELDVRVLAVEPTPAGCARAARMVGLPGGRTPMLLVQNHTRKFELDAGAKLLTEAGVGAPRDAAVPFDASLPDLASRGWPGERLPRALRKPVAALAGRMFERALDASPAVAGAGA